MQNISTAYNIKFIGDEQLADASCLTNEPGMFIIAGELCFYSPELAEILNNNDGDLYLSTMTDNGDNTITHSNGMGSSFTFNQGNTVEVVDGVLTVTRPDGTTAVLDVCAALAFCELADLENVGGTPTDGQFLAYDSASSTWVPADVAPETITAMTDNGDGTITYESEDGTETTFNVGWTEIVEEANGDLTINYPDGTSQTFSVLSTMTNEGDGTYTHSAGGVDTVIDTTADSNPVENPQEDSIFDDASAEPNVEELLNLIASRLGPIPVNTTCCMQPLETVTLNATSSHTFDDDFTPDTISWEIKDENGDEVLTLEGGPEDAVPVAGPVVGGTYELPTLNFKLIPGTKFMTCLTATDTYGNTSTNEAQAPLMLIDESLMCVDGTRLLCDDGTCITC